MSSRLEAEIGLDSSQYVKGIDQMAKAMVSFSDETNKKMDALILSMTKFEQSAQKTSDTAEGQSQKQVNSFGKIEKSLLAVGVASSGMFANMIAQSPGLSSAFAEMQFMINEVFAVLGESLAPIIEDYVVPVVESLTEAILNLDPETQKFIASAIGLGSVLGLALPIIIQLSSALGVTGMLKSSLEATKGLSKMGKAISLLTSPLGLVVLAIGLFALAYTTNFAGVKDMTDKTVGRIVERLKSWKEENKETFDRIGGKLKELWETIKPVVEAITVILVGVLLATIEFLVERTLNKIDFMIAVFEGLIDFFTAVFKGDWEGALASILGIFDAWIEKVTSNFEAFVDLISNIMENIAEHLDIGEYTDIVIEFVTNGVEGALNWLIDGFNGFLDILNKPLNALRESTFLSQAIRDSIPDLNNYKIDRVSLGGSDSADSGGTFHRGGIVPGRIGEERIVKVLAGEVISNPMRGQTPMSVMAQNSGVSQTPIVITINNTFTNPNFTNEIGMRNTVNQIDNSLRKNVGQYISGR